jgi:large subunit ribosomal protein L5e
MGKRKTKRRSNSALGVTSYFKRFQVKFARRRAGACDAPVISTAKP